VITLATQRIGQLGPGLPGTIDGNGLVLQPVAAIGPKQLFGDETAAADGDGSQRPIEYWHRAGYDETDGDLGKKDHQDPAQCRQRGRAQDCPQCSFWQVANNRTIQPEAD